jgi:hypothetical protein
VGVGNSALRVELSSECMRDTFLVETGAATILDTSLDAVGGLVNVRVSGVCGSVYALFGRKRQRILVIVENEFR